MEKTKSVDLIVGGQYGSEGKGAVVAYLAKKSHYDVAVRVGAPNAGHTVQVGDQKWKMRQLPCAGLVDDTTVLCVGANGLLEETVLKAEMDLVPHSTTRLKIDRNAGIVTEKHRLNEQQRRMFEKLGSTCEGIGEAQAEKVLRTDGFLRAKDVGWLKPFVTNVSDYLNEAVDRGLKIMIEGTQGYGISLNHGEWPFVTSRDVISASLLSDSGLAPTVVNNVYMVVRTYPIRVAGNSGPMGADEIDWPTVPKRCGAPEGIITELTTVTKRVRRVSEFNEEMVVRAVKANRPSAIALMFADYIDWKNHGVNKYENLTSSAKRFIDKIQELTGVPVTLVGTGPDITHMVDRLAEGPILH